MGEDVDVRSSKGMHLVITDSVPPFAIGRFTGPTIEIYLRNHEANRVIDGLKMQENQKVCHHEKNHKLPEGFDFHHLQLEDVFNETFIDTHFTELDLL